MREKITIIEDDILNEDIKEKEMEISMLMKEIDEKVNRFALLTGAKANPVKKRWRDIKKSAGR